MALSIQTLRDIQALLLSNRITYGGHEVSALTKVLRDIDLELTTGIITASRTTLKPPENKTEDPKSRKGDLGE